MALQHNASTSALDSLQLCLDAQNLKSYSRNVHPNPKDLWVYVRERTTGGTNNCAIFRDVDIDPSPAGGVPLRMVCTGNDPHISGMYNAPLFNLASANNGDTWGVSVYVKANNTNCTGEFFIFGANSSTGSSQIGSNFMDIRNRQFGFGTNWVRVNTIVGFSNSNTQVIQVRIDGPITTNANTYTVWWDGLQVERLPANSTSVTDFVDSNSSKLGGDWLDITSKNGRVTFAANTVYSNNSITFNGTNWADFTCNNLSTIATVEMWARVKSSSAKMFFGWSAYNVYFNGSLGYNTANSDVYGISSATATSLNLLNNWHHYVFEMTTTSSYTNNKIYIDGVLQTLSQQTGFENPANLSFNNGNGRIAMWKNGSVSYMMPMDCNIFKVYNRALTQSEITKNYQAHKGRFGL
jgi:hypothetical protein